MSIVKVLTVAGSDSIAGAGIQADLKAFAALGTYGASVITAVTAQNSQQIIGVQPMSVQIVEEQLQAVFDDVKFDAVKIGMLVNEQIMEIVISSIHRYLPRIIVLDPVMVSKHHGILLEEGAIDKLKGLLPFATLLTPNIPEAARLTGQEEAETQDQIIKQGQILIDMGAQNVLIKGGHLHYDETSPDYLVCSSGAISVFKAKRVKTNNTHGTGCTLSSAIAAELAKDSSNFSAAIQKAKIYVTNALIASDQLDVGSGFGPLNHFYEFWSH